MAVVALQWDDGLKLWVQFLIIFGYLQAAVLGLMIFKDVFRCFWTLFLRLLSMLSFRIDWLLEFFNDLFACEPADYMKECDDGTCPSKIGSEKFVTKYVYEDYPQNTEKPEIKPNAEKPEIKLYAEEPLEEKQTTQSKQPTDNNTAFDIEERRCKCFDEEPDEDNQSKTKNSAYSKGVNIYRTDDSLLRRHGLSIKETKTWVKDDPNVHKTRSKYTESTVSSQVLPKHCSKCANKNFIAERRKH